MGTDEDPSLTRHPKPQGDPDSSRGDADKERRGRGPVSMNINKWAKPIPKLELPLQKANKIKQIWEMWSVNVALATSTWNDVAVTYWHQVYHQSEESNQNWRHSMATKLQF